MKPLADAENLLVLDQHVGLVGVARRDDRATLDQRAHRSSSPIRLSSRRVHRLARGLSPCRDRRFVGHS